MLTRMRQRLNAEDGLSLVELLIIMLLLGLIGSTVTTSLVRGMKATSATQSRFDALADLQKSVDRMTRNLRAADPLLFTSSTAQRAVVEVYRDETFTQKLRYTYTYCSTQQRIHVKTETNPVSAPAAANCAAMTDPVLISSVSNGATPVFQFFKVDGVTPATSAKDALTMKVTVSRAMRNQTAIRVDTLVRLRNVR